MKKQKNFYIIAGPNGAGKTTTAKTIVQNVFHCQNFVNADEIARGLSPFNNQRFDIEAGKLMLNRIQYYSENGEDFSVETTLSSVLYLKKIKEFKKLDYKITLFFIHLSSEEIAIERVIQRVKKGGHNVDEKIIRRRFKKGLENLMNQYFDKVDELQIYNNDSDLRKIACKVDNKINIYDQKIFQQIASYKND